tara:strand:- start:16298 stop:16474 length:177 start_codon:yes stop_codon:yes gene_type:complete
MAKWVLPETKEFTLQMKIIKAMQKHNMTLEETLEAIEEYADNKSFEEELAKTYLCSSK